MQKDNLRRLIITTALGAGDNTLIAGGQLGAGIGSIRVWQILVESNGIETVTPKSGTTVIAGNFILPGMGSSATLQGTGIPWQECLPGQSLVWNLATGGTLTGTIYYSIA